MRGKALDRSLTRSKQEAQGAKARGRLGALDGSRGARPAPPDAGEPDVALVADVVAVRTEAARTRRARRYRATPQSQELPTMASLVRRSAPALAVYPAGKWCSTSRTAGGGVAHWSGSAEE